MPTSLDQLTEWLNAEEGDRFEFKQAKNNFHFDKLVQYSVAIANEGGGKIILGVTDKRPRRVVGTRAFDNVERTKQGLIERLRLRFEVEEFAHSDGRVLIIHVPGRPLGMPVQYEGAYWMRSGDALVPMAPDMLKRIFEESGPDFSAEFCREAAIADLDSAAIDDFRQRWMRHSGNAALAGLSSEQILADAELTVGDKLTYAALILFGTRAVLGNYLAQAETIFEYRSSEASLPAQQRVEYRQGFFGYYEDLWHLINSRNDRQSYQDGLFRWEIPTFDEQVVREAILNAVSHRDYRLGGSVFVRQYARRVEMISPGGLPAGITPENILDRQSPRNRRIAEAFARCGLIERSGQGVNRMYEQSIKQSKPLPDFAGSDEYQVRLVLRGDVQDASFVRFLEKLGAERLASFGTHELLVLNCVRQELPVPEGQQDRIERLLELGVIERVGRGRGARLLLSRSLYAAMGATGAYTRKRGLDHETNKALVLKHLQGNRRKGSPISELHQVLPALSASHLKRLLAEMRDAGQVRLEGKNRWARWFPATGLKRLLRRFL